MKKYHRMPPIEIILLILLSIAFLALIILEMTFNIFGIIRFLSEQTIIIYLNIIQTLIVVIFINRGLKLRKNILRKSYYLEKKGISNVHVKGVASQKEIAELYREAGLIKICVVGGINYFLANKDYIVDALKNRNVIIRVLLANENSDFVKQITDQLDDINYIEDKRNANNRQKDEIIETKNLLESWNTYKYNKGVIEVRQYDTEYRVPFYIGYYKDKSDDENADWEIIRGWYNSITPVCSPRQTIMFSGELDFIKRNEYVKNSHNPGVYKNKKGELEFYVYRNELIEENRHFIMDLETHFDYLWKKYDI